MTWSYAEPTSQGWQDPIHEVRYLLADTRGQTPQSPSDEVLKMLLQRYTDAEGPDPYAAAATAAATMGDQFTAEADSVSKGTGNTNISRTYTNRSGRYRSLADRLWGLARFPRDDRPRNQMGGFGLASRDQAPRQFAIGQFDTPGVPDGPSAESLPAEREWHR